MRHVKNSARHLRPLESRRLHQQLQRVFVLYGVAAKDPVALRGSLQVGSFSLKPLGSD